MMKKKLKKPLIIGLVVLVFLVRIVNGFIFKDTIDFGATVLTDMGTYPTDYESLAVIEIKQGSLNGFHILPNEKTESGVIVTFGGSEGGCNYFQGIELANKGY